MNRTRTRALLALTLLGLCPSSEAADIAVYAGGDYDTIQAAVFDAVDGDRIVIKPGVYPEQLTIFAKQITLEPDGTPGDVVVQSPNALDYTLVDISGGGGDVTINDLVFDGLGQRRVMEVSNQAHATLTGVTLRNGVNPDGYPGAGLDVFINGSATVVDSLFDNNQATNAAYGMMPWGGNVAVEGGTSVTLQGTTLQNGRAERGGGLWVSSTASATVSQSTLANNIAVGQGDNDGGGVCAESGAGLVVVGANFTTNTAGTDDFSQGGGIYAGGALVSISGSSFSGNTAHMGGGVGIEDGSLVSWSNVFAGNSGDKGAAIGCDSAFQCGVLDSQFEDNSAGGGGAIFSWNSALTLGGARLCFNNTAAGIGNGDGGAVQAQYGGVDAFNSAFVENTAAGSGGAISVRDAVMQSTNNHYVGNAAGVLGGAFYGFDYGGIYAPAASVNDLFFGNDAATDGAVHHAVGVSGSVTYGWMYDNAPNHGTIGASPTNFVDVADPMLTGWYRGAACDPILWQLQPGSQLIDQGDPAIGDLDGSLSDIGAFGGDRMPDGALDDFDGDGIPQFFDCNDADPGVGLGSRWYVDADNDGWGWALTWQDACTQPPGWVADSGDCNDADPLINPWTAWFPDADGDGLGDPDFGVQGCEPGAGYVLNSDDCNDADPAILGPQTWFADNDGDGFGSDGSSLSCDPIPGFTQVGGDCNDADPSIHPGADELCDDVDHDCEGTTNNSPIDGEEGYVDGDGDGYGAGEITTDCDPGRLSDLGDDCDDTDPNVYPGAKDAWYDGVDSNCDGKSDQDADGDGFDVDVDCDDGDPMVNPGAPDLVDDGVDGDCNGTEARSWIAGGGCACDGGSGGGGTALGGLLLALATLRRRR